MSWSKKDELEANDDGWSIGGLTGQFYFVIKDNSRKFHTYDDLLTHVIKRAEEGSGLHRRAIAESTKLRMLK